jgi:hypothetical protein
VVTMPINAVISMPLSIIINQLFVQTFVPYSSHKDLFLLLVLLLLYVFSKTTLLRRIS